MNTYPGKTTIQEIHDQKVYFFYKLKTKNIISINLGWQTAVAGGMAQSSWTNPKIVFRYSASQ